jgi:hypothetical protein
LELYELTVPKGFIPQLDYLDIIEVALTNSFLDFKKASSAFALQKLKIQIDYLTFSGGDSKEGQSIGDAIAGKH